MHPQIVFLSYLPIGTFLFIASVNSRNWYWRLRRILRFVQDHAKFRSTDVNKPRITLIESLRERKHDLIATELIRALWNDPQEDWDRLTRIDYLKHLVLAPFLAAYWIERVPWLMRCLEYTVQGATFDGHEDLAEAYRHMAPGRGTDDHYDDFRQLVRFIHRNDKPVDPP